MVNKRDSVISPAKFLFVLTIDSNIIYRMHPV